MGGGGVWVCGGRAAGEIGGVRGARSGWGRRGVGVGIAVGGDEDAAADFMGGYAGFCQSGNTGEFGEEGCVVVSVGVLVFRGEVWCGGRIGVRDGEERGERRGERGEKEDIEIDSDKVFGTSGMKVKEIETGRNLKSTQERIWQRKRQSINSSRKKRGNQLTAH